MDAVKADLNKVRAVTWSLVKERSSEEFCHLLDCIQCGFPDNRSALSPELNEFWECRRNLYIFDGVIHYNDRVW